MKYILIFFKYFQILLIIFIVSSTIYSQDTMSAVDYNNRGIAYSDKGLYDQAIADYTKALELNPKDADAYYNRGLAFRKQGLYDQAIADYTKTLELNPKDAEAYYNKALACEDGGRIKEAIEAYQGFIQYAPSQYASYVEYAKQRIQALKGE